MDEAASLDAPEEASCERHEMLLEKMASDPAPERLSLLSCPEDSRPATIQAAPKVLPPRAKRKVIEVRKLVSEQSRIKSAVEASGLLHAQGYLELESQLQNFMAEVEEKRANAEAVILDLVKELVRTAQEVESMNSQGAMVEERLDAVEAHLRELEGNWASKGSRSVQEPHLLEDPDVGDDDTLPFAPWARGEFRGAVRASHTLGVGRAPSERCGRREVATWGGSGFVAPGEKLLAKAKALNTRTLVGPPAERESAKALATREASQKLLEATAARAAAEALEKAKASLAALREELRSEIATAAAAERDKAAESFAALEKALAVQVEAALGDLTARKGPTARLPVEQRRCEERAASAPTSAESGLQPPTEPSQGDIDSPKTLTAKKPRTSFRMLGALVPACLGVIKKPEVDEPS